MGVYINMETPTSCGYCPLRHEARDGDECYLGASLTEYQKRPDDCPLVPVPLHGRLISADELIEFIENRYEITWKDDYEGGIKDACIDVLEKISTMPTVIPASEEE